MRIWEICQSENGGEPGQWWLTIEVSGVPTNCSDKRKWRKQNTLKMGMWNHSSWFMQTSVPWSKDGVYTCVCIYICGLCHPIIIIKFLLWIYFTMKMPWLNLIQPCTRLLCCLWSSGQLLQEGHHVLARHYGNLHGFKKFTSHQDPSSKVFSILDLRWPKIHSRSR